jgi:hypothetical protein
MMRRVLVIGLLVGLVAGLTAIPAYAQPTEDEVREAIGKGVAWLAAQQDATYGYWPGVDLCGVTALAVKKLEHHAVDSKWGLGLESPFDDANPYKENIEKGLEWLLGRCAYTVDIGLQPAGDPDSDGNGVGVSFGGLPTYTSGIALMAICEAVELDRVVEIGPLKDWTYEKVARNTMDYLAFGQNDWGSGQGGWGYAENGGWSDNSNTGYATLGLGYAEAAWPDGCSFEVPQFVKDELNIWIDYIQNDTGEGWYEDPLGGSGYEHPESWVNVLKTGNLLQQMAFVGDTVNTPRVQDALDYLARHWSDPNQDPGWRGDDETSSYQATFTAMKGLTSLGLYEEFGDPPIYWQEDFETELVTEQIPAPDDPDNKGYWSGCEWGDPILCTTWALLTLQKVAPDLTPPEVGCLETVNPHGKNVPPAGKTTLPGPKGGQNEDGFYELTAWDAVDPDPQIFVVDAGSGTVFGPFASGAKIKYTEAKGATPSQKKIGSSNGQADAVDWHIIGNGDPEVYAVDASGNQSDAASCLVPPPPK